MYYHSLDAVPVDKDGEGPEDVAVMDLAEDGNEVEASSSTMDEK